MVFALVVVLVSSVNTPQARFFAAERFQTFVTIFLSLFIEAAPFLIAGSIVSGIIAVYVNQGMVERYIPNHPLLAALAGAGLGFVFPVCECGVVPVTRRLYSKGLPLPVGIAFLLAAPVINPVVIFSTYAAFGWGPVLWGRVVFSMLVAFSVGLIFHLARPREILLPETLTTSDIHSDDDNHDQYDEHDHHHDHNRHHEHSGSRPGIWQALVMAGDDFLDMGRYSDRRRDAGGDDADGRSPVHFAHHRSRADHLGLCDDGTGVYSVGLLDGGRLYRAGFQQRFYDRSAFRLSGVRADGGYQEFAAVSRGFPAADRALSDSTAAGVGGGYRCFLERAGGGLTDRLA